MSHSKSYEFLLKDISILKRVGQKTKKILKKKKIETLLFGILISPFLFKYHLNKLSSSKRNKLSNCFNSIMPNLLIYLLTKPLSNKSISLVPRYSDRYKIFFLSRSILFIVQLK